MRNKYISKFKLHSIPILLSKSRSRYLRHVSYSIPLISAMALLLLIGNIFCLFSKTPEVFADSADSNVETYATTPDPTVSLTINGSTSAVSLSSNATAGGDTAYTTPATVAYSANDVSTYALQISYAKGSTGLARENATNTTTIGGAGGKAGSTMADNTWGYAWVDNSANTDATTLANATYYTIPTYGTSGTSLATGQLESGNNAGSGTNKLVFAAKFGSEAIAGHYKASVLLSLAVTPKELTLGFGGENNRITTMQEMTPEVCASAEIGEAGAGILKDIRDNNIYNVTRLDDGNCWMTSNLSLTKESIAKAGNSPKLTSESSNVADDSTFIMPDSIETLSSTTSPKDFSNEVDYNNIAQIYDGGSKDPRWKPSYGSYYNWYAATAGTGNAELTTAGEEASGSICPKGWVLPSRNDYETLLSVANITNNAEGSAKLRGKPYNFSLAGAILDGILLYVGDSGGNGDYWAKTVYDQVNSEYLIFSVGKVGIDKGLRHRGRSVRCVAPSVAEDPAPEVSGFGGIKKMQDMTTEICTKATANSTGQLYDSRDNSIYTVGKLSDGKCWMTQNLRIVGKTITPSSSDVSTKYAIPESTTSGWSTTDFAATNVFYDGDETYGAYYTWCAATANSCLEATEANANAASSICPKGWKIPTSAEFTKLTAPGGTWGPVNGINGSTIGGAFFPAGSYYLNGLADRTSRGFLWTSTASSSSSAFFLLFYQDYLNPAYSPEGRQRIQRNYGVPIRCIAK